MIEYENELLYISSSRIVLEIEPTIIALSLASLKYEVPILFVCLNGRLPEGRKVGIWLFSIFPYNQGSR